MIVVRNFDELQSLGREKVAGKIVLFDYHFDKLMAAQGQSGEAYGQAVKYRADGGPHTRVASAPSRLRRRRPR